MESFTFDAPPLGTAPTDPVGRLARCVTLDDVHRSPTPVRALLTPVLGPARHDGATRQVVRAFAQLLRHPLGPSVATEALGLAAAAAGLVTSHQMAEFLTQANASRRSFRPLTPTEQRLVRQRLQTEPDRRRRFEAMVHWWHRSHRGLELSLDDWFDLDPWALLALAPAGRLTAQMRWMPPESVERLMAHPLLFSRRHDADSLAELVRGNLAAVAANPACTSRVLRHLASQPVPATPPSAVRDDGTYAVPGLVRWVWNDRLPAAQLGWLHLPPWEEDPGGTADLPLIAAVDRPPSPLCHLAGEPEPPWRFEGTACVQAVRSMVELLDGSIVEAQGAWTLEVLRTREDIDTNARMMGNCTAHLYGPPERSGRILCRLINGDKVLNAAFHPDGEGGWFVAEINSRQNSGEFPGVLWRTLRDHIGARAARARYGRQRPNCTECDTGRPAMGTICLECRTGRYEHLERWVYAA
jgi:hypothetical protein